MPHDTLIGVEQLARHLTDAGWRIVDCRFDLADTQRGERDYAAAHIPGARYAHLDRDLSGPITPDSGRHPLPPPERLCAWLGAHAIEPAEQIVAYDDSGGTMAVRLWWLLRWLGYRNAAVLDGGWQAWTDAALPTTGAVPPKPVPTRPDCRPDPALVVDTDALATVLQQDSGMPVLMDARTGERFRGEAEPIDPVAGHIPGAINVPLADNLDSHGRFKAPEVLRQRYLTVLGSAPPETVIAMCGSGVTACHNLLAMVIAGLPLGRLYAGSWSEWIRDPARPIASGD